MIEISTDAKMLLMDNRTTLFKADLILANGTSMPIVGDDVMANTVVFSDSVSSSNSFDIGSAIINSLSLTLNNYDDRFSLVDFTGAKIRPYIGIPLETTEWITKGYYTVDKPTSIGNTIPLTMLDNMSKFEKPYREVIQTFPATVSQILQSICIYCGVVLDGTTFPNYDFSIAKRPEDENLSCLDMVSAIAQLAGCYARINNQGYLQMMWYDTEAFNDYSEDYDGGTFLTNTTPYSDGDSLDGGDFSYDGTEDSADGGGFVYGNYFSCYAFSSFSVGTDDITITGIKVTVDSDNYYAVGEDGYVLEITDNPLITVSNMQYIANYLGNRIVGLKFRPFNVSALSDPTVEAGDAIRLTDRKGNYYDSFVTSCSYKFGNYESFACNAETVSERNATDYSPLTKAVEQARKDTQKALSTYDEAVKNMSSLQSNALGFYETFTTELDGSRISYMHDQPVLADSSIIWKKSVSGMFVSTDGGVTWGGMTADLNIVAKVLNVIGINADWINAGTITGRKINGGTIIGASINIGNGVFTVDTSGKMKCTNAEVVGKVTATDGVIGGIKVNSNGLGTSNLGEALDGMWMTPSGDLSFAHQIGNTWSQMNYRQGSNVLGLWTAGANAGGGGLDVSGGSPGDYEAGWIRWGWSDGQRSDNYYVAWYSGSDRRLKKNIKTLDNKFVRELFEKLNLVSFNYNKLSCADTEELRFGVIAQEIEAVLEDLGIQKNHIIEEKEVLRKTPAGKEKTEIYKYVNYSEFHALEMAAIKDLYETIDRQQSEMAELKQRVRYLMEKVGG